MVILAIRYVLTMGAVFGLPGYVNLVEIDCDGTPAAAELDCDGATEARIALEITCDALTPLELTASVTVR